MFSGSQCETENRVGKNIYKMFCVHGLKINVVRYRVHDLGIDIL